MYIQTLIACIHRNDPFQPSLAGGPGRRGPVLRVLEKMTADRIVIVHHPDDADRASELEEAVRLAFPLMDCARVAQPGGESLAEDLRRTLAREGAREGSYEDPCCAVCLTSADPDTRNALLHLAARGDLSFRLLDVRPDAGYGDEPGVDEIIVVRRAVRQADGATSVNEPRAVYAARARRTAPRGDAAILEVARACGIAGEHPALMRALEQAAAVAEHDVPVLIQGETGTGKGLLARFVHAVSGRPQDKFIAVNCGALPEKLVESVLFGHTRGAFTGATADRIGKFELADGGTLFLDEIGEMPAELQPKLLRVLEDGVVEPVGARAGRPVNVRVVAATNRDLKKDMAERRFREDLYYRLSFAVLALPPLRERRSDIPILAAHMLQRINAGLRSPRSFAPATLAWLESRDWRGNARDLENTVGRSALMARNDVLQPEDMLFDEQLAAEAAYQLPEPCESFSMDRFLAEARRELIQRALNKTGGNQSAAARLLGVTPQAISKHLLASGSQQASSLQPKLR